MSRNSQQTQASLVQTNMADDLLVSERVIHTAIPGLCSCCGEVTGGPSPWNAASACWCYTCWKFASNWCLVCGQCTYHCPPSQRSQAHTQEEYEAAAAIFYGPGGLIPTHNPARYRTMLERIYANGRQEYLLLP
jgi:hypothetical protein